MSTKAFFALSAMIAAPGLTGCGGDPVMEPKSPADTITIEDLAGHIEALASDAFLGRAPATEGEEKTLAYLKAEFERIGLKPAIAGSYFQEVPLVEIFAVPNIYKSRGGLIGEKVTTSLQYGQHILLWTKFPEETVIVDKVPMVFVGYGIHAPEYDWNDYEGVDVTGKTVAMFINDPGYATGDANLFNGRAMTYYGRWSYKFEEAARQGAAAALIIHQSKAAGYPWPVVKSSWSGPQLDLVRETDAIERVRLEGWIQEEIAELIFERSGISLEEAQRAALSPDFQAMEIPLAFYGEVNNEVRRTASNNVIGMIEGNERPDEAVLYMAHWDHLGVDVNMERKRRDLIYNGAVDNASGVAGLIEIAEAFTQRETLPKRSIVFLATTAEEQGLLGATYYAQDPVIGAENTVAAINMDGLNVLGPMADITVIGWNQNELQDYLERAANAQGRKVTPEPTPEHGYFYRSDHFALAKVGVPVLYADSGVEHLQKGREWALAQREDYTALSYHKPADEFSDDWDLAGAVDDLQLFYAVGAELADTDARPQWFEGSEFRSIREGAAGASR